MTDAEAGPKAVEDLMDVRCMVVPCEVSGQGLGDVLPFLVARALELALAWVFL
jgi:hypothetical protein